MTDEEVLAFLEHQQFLRLEDYVKRGRDLVGVGTDDLRDRWVAEFKTWAAAPQAVSPGARGDIEGELALRGERPPLDLVKDEFEAIRAACRAKLAQLMGDPLALARAERNLTVEIVEFSQSGKIKPPN
jgi:hypothetical protein